MEKSCTSWDDCNTIDDRRLSGYSTILVSKNVVKVNEPEIMLILFLLQQQQQQQQQQQTSPFE